MGSENSLLTAPRGSTVVHAPKFKPGDVVYLKSGGPGMTVDGVANGMVGCVWFDSDGHDHERVFSEVLLTADGG